MRILFVTRKYPPSTGGMENAAFELYTALSVVHDVTLVKWGGANKLLPVIYPWLFLQALIKGFKKTPSVIYVQDGLMAPMGWLLKLLLGRPTIMTIHGKEATYANPLYQAIVPRFVRKQTRLVAVSNETKRIVQEALPGTDPLVIFNGLRDAFYKPHRDLQLANIAGAIGMPLAELREYKILHTNGRLIRRKGVLWFIDEVMPKLVLGQKVLYIVSGKGKDQELLEAAITEHKLEKNVYLLGRVSDEVLQSLYNAADIFVMPNIPVANDMEGFGLVALEAASCGTTVVASKLEGIQDAISNGQNGFMLTPLSAEEYVNVIARELRRPTLNPQTVRDYTLSHYSWTETARQYTAVMQQIVKH